jgi:hypothetical protein
MACAVRDAGCVPGMMRAALEVSAGPSWSSAISMLTLVASRVAADVE